MLREEGKGGCPFIEARGRSSGPNKTAAELAAANGGVLPPAPHSIAAGGDISQCPYFNPALKNKDAAAAAASAAAGPAMPASAVNGAAPHAVAAGSDISQCPFFNPALKKDTAAASTVTTPVVAAPSTVTTPVVAGEVPVKGQCPIPFHNQLASPKFWLVTCCVLLSAMVASRVWNAKAH